MKGVYRNHAQARVAEQRPSVPQLSPEQSPSSTSGTYFRAVRPTEAETAAMACGEQIFDGEKVERLRSTVEAAMWRSDAELIAERMLDDAS